MGVIQVLINVLYVSTQYYILIIWEYSHRPAKVNTKIIRRPKHRQQVHQNSVQPQEVSALLDVFSVAHLTIPAQDVVPTSHTLCVHCMPNKVDITSFKFQ